MISSSKSNCAFRQRVLSQLRDVLKSRCPAASAHPQDSPNTTLSASGCIVHLSQAISSHPCRLLERVLKECMDPGFKHVTGPSGGVCFNWLHPCKQCHCCVCGNHLEFTAHKPHSTPCWYVETHPASKLGWHNHAAVVAFVRGNIRSYAVAGSCETKH